MSGPANSSADVIVEEIRRQVDHQVGAASDGDTKALALFGGAATVATLLLPRLSLQNLQQGAISAIALATLVLALASFVDAVRPRPGKFSNGPKVDVLAGRLTSTMPDLMADLVDSFHKVRDKNEDFLRHKADRTLSGLYFSSRR